MQWTLQDGASTAMNMIHICLIQYPLYVPPHETAEARALREAAARGANVACTRGSLSATACLSLTVQTRTGTHTHGPSKHSVKSRSQISVCIMAEETCVRVCVCVCLCSGRGVRGSGHQRSWRSGVAIYNRHDLTVDGRSTARGERGTCESRYALLMLVRPSDTGGRSHAGHESDIVASPEISCYNPCAIHPVLA